jgi:3-hexulose-6-phosphate synthase / 6-phospho-3-hexuloisomerase
MTKRSNSSRKIIVPAGAPGAGVILQVALDFAELARALTVAEESMAGGADWIEAGTPLIKSEGLDCVRALREKFPGTPIVADLKTMDAGRAEMEMAAKAGASLATVLAAASDATIAECVEAGRNYGIKIAVDLIGVSDPVKRAKEVAALGVDYVNVHVPIDAQMRGEDPLEALREVAAAVTIPVGVAGGVNSETAAACAAAGASVVIVGGAVTKSADCAAATRQIKESLRSGKAVKTALYKRVGPDEIRKALLAASPANLSDALHRGGAISELKPVKPGLRMAGPCRTVRTVSGDWAKPVEAIDRALPGEVLIIDAGGAPPAVWGELATHSAMIRKLAGVAVWGAVRDTSDIMRLGFPVFTRMVSPNAGDPRGVGEIDAPLLIAGVRVRSGDWISGDDDGVVVLPAERAVEYANRAMDVLEKENRLRAEIEAGGTLAEKMELLKWEKKR